MRCCFLVFITLSALQAQQNTTAAGRQQDLDYVSTTLTKLDVNFFSQLDQATFQTAVNSLQSKLAAATDPEFYVAQLVAMSADMHTALPISTAFGYPSLPLTLRWLEEGVFVTAAPQQYSQTIGTQIVAVNGTPIDQVVQQLGTTYAHANDQYLHYMAASYLPSLFVLQGLDLIPAKATTVNITFQTLGGAQFTAAIAPDGNDAPLSGIPGSVPGYLQNPNSYYWLNYIAANRMLYAKYNRCTDDPNGISVATYSAQILQALDANLVDTVVIDFRNNGGGNEYLLYPLGVGLFNRLSTLRINPNFRIYLVIDKGSFSSGMYTPMAFKSGFLAQYENIAMPDTNGIMYVIGEATSGKPIGFGNVLNYYLPYSNFYGYYSTVFVNQNEGVIPDLPSFYPDIEVPTRAADYFAGHDPVMAAMLARFTGAPPAASGAVTTTNAASFRADVGVAPGSLAAAFGAFPVAPDKVSVGGFDATPISASTSQVNFLVPPSSSTGSAIVSVRASGQELANGQVTISASSPGIFVASPTRSQPGAVLNEDASMNSPQTPATTGSIVQIFATGYGASATTQVYIDANPAQVLYSGPITAFAGLWQINAQIPANTPAGINPLFIVSDNTPSNAVTIAVRNP